MSEGSARISPTAYYTSHVWVRNGLSDAALDTREGRVFYAVLEGPMRLLALTGARTLENWLLLRHRTIDHLLTAAIERGEVSQVLEIAGGMSGRGARFAARYPDIVYVEGDLPGMARHKRARLAAGGLVRANHRVVELDALATAGPLAIGAIDEAQLDASRGLAVITEGLLGYLSPEQLRVVWSNVRGALSRHASGVYLAETHLHVAMRQAVGALAFRRLLGWFVKGRTYVHFEDTADAVRALNEAGFGEADVYDPRVVLGVGGGLPPVCIAEARLAR